MVPDLLRKKTSLPLALYVFFCRIEREVRTGNKDPDFYYSYYHLNKLLGANFEHIPMFKQKLKPIVKYINNNKNIHFKLEDGYEKHLGTNRDFAVLRIRLIKKRSKSND